MRMGNPAVCYGSKVKVGGVVAWSICLVISLFPPDTACFGSQANWRRDVSYSAGLANKSIEARFQGGFLVELKDLGTDRTLVSVQPGELRSTIPLFGSGSVDLDKCTISQQVAPDSVSTRYKAPDGTTWELLWTIEQGEGDLILRSSAKTPKPVEELRAFVLGCDIRDHDLVWVHGYGVGHQVRAPWNSTFLGDPLKDSSPSSHVHPLVTLFQGDRSGWFLEGREPRIGPACVMVGGRGQTADVAMVRRFPIPTRTPAMYEIRLRTYKDHWQDAVDPYIDWMEHEVGFVPLDKRPKAQAWVNDIKNQAYVRVGDFETLQALARRVDPSKTLVGRMVGWRHYPMDIGYPDYRVSDVARRWFRKARELGFHVGAHFNSKNIDRVIHPQLVERFRPGFAVVGTDPNGAEIYESIQGGRNIRCSAAYKPWRDYLIAQMKDAVEAGVDVIYLDESMAPAGKFVVDGVDGIEGLMLLMKEVLETYPHVAIETEQFNPMANRHAAFALSQMALGHPLGGYILHRFVHIVPEGVMYSPTDNSLMDAFACWGFMLPGAHWEQSWLDIAKAFEDYDLVPDSRMPRLRAARFVPDGRGGLYPVLDEAACRGGCRLFSYRGRDGVTAYFERKANKRGLVVYQPQQPPRWVGTRVSGVSTWSGPGILREMIPGVDKWVDWLIYDGEKMLGLDPRKTYLLDETGSLPQDRFHVTSIPEDFALHYDDSRYIRPQDMGRDGSYYKLTFTGHGRLTLYVPDDVHVFLDAKRVPVDRSNDTAVASVSADAGKPSQLLAFRQSDVILSGKWTDLPWQAPPKQRVWFLAQHVNYGYPSDGPVRSLYKRNGFTTHVAGEGVIIGKLPKAKSIHLKGAYRMGEQTTGSEGDGVIKLNGQEVLRIPPGPKPYKTHCFDVDVSRFAGQYVMLEFACDGQVRGAGSADWYDPYVDVRD